MSKIKILSWKEAQPTFYKMWWQPLLTKYFDLVWLDDTSTYHSPKDSLVIVRPFIHDWQEKISQYRTQGYKVIFDDLWERPFDSVVVDEVMTLRSKNFFRLNESLWWKYLNFDQYSPTLTKTKKFLLLMRLSRPHRDHIYRQLTPILNQAIYSYVAQGKTLESDINHSDPNWQRHFDSAWYDSTDFSIVAETSMKAPTFVTEKSYKPIAYYHPFVVFGTPGTLAHVRDQGFETFNHMIDERYDSEQNESQRFKQVRSIVFDLVAQIEKNPKLFQDPLTQKKLHHNHNTFFNFALVEKLFYDDILTQIFNFVESS